MKPISIGLLGIGTVGGGTFSVLGRNHAEIVRRAGRDLVISVVADKDLGAGAADYAGQRRESPTMPGRWCAIRMSTSSSN